MVLTFIISVFALFETAIFGSICTLDLGIWIDIELLVVN
jgi:hypothetical protein